MPDRIRPTVAQEMVRHSTAYYDEAVAKLAKRLRDMADRVEIEGKPYDRPSPSGTPRYSHAAEAVQNAITWDLANAHAAHLTGAAARADAAETALAAEQAAASGQR